MPVGRATPGRADLYAAVMEGAGSVRPKMMTVVVIMAGLLPIMGHRHRQRR